MSITAQQGMIYKHRKGSLYIVLYLARDTDLARFGGDNDTVVYKSVKEDDHQVWVRSRKEFEDGRFTMIAANEFPEIV